jgi:hypothetical protein
MSGGDNMKKLKVRIPHNGRIPFLGGNGPILSPIYLPEKQVRQIQLLIGKDKVEIINENKEEKVIPVASEKLEETVIVKEVEIPRVEEEPVEEEVPEVVEEVETPAEEEEVSIEEDGEEEVKASANGRKKNRR